jgi:hypothetical protein
MARPTLSGHRKFRRLSAALASRVIARGVLELLWDACYEAGDDYLGTAADLEALVSWPGDPGKLALALAACGLPEGHGFIEPVSDGHGGVTYRVHDLWHHAPDYVRKRHHRENERRQKSVPVMTDRRTAPNGAERRHVAPTPDCLTGVDRTPAPAPAPAPVQEQEQQQERADAFPRPVENLLKTSDVRVLRHRRRRSRETRDGRPAKRVIVALARDVLRAHPQESDAGELRERVKAACSKANLQYDGATVGQALDEALAQVRGRKAEPA